MTDAPRRNLGAVTCGVARRLQPFGVTVTNLSAWARSRRPYQPWSGISNWDGPISASGCDRINATATTSTRPVTDTKPDDDRTPLRTAAARAIPIDPEGEVTVTTV